MVWCTQVHEFFPIKILLPKSPGLFHSPPGQCYEISRDGWCTKHNHNAVGSWKMVYLPTWMVDFYGKCRWIYHTFRIWESCWKSHTTERMHQILSSVSLAWTVDILGRNIVSAIQRLINHHCAFINTPQLSPSFWEWVPLPVSHETSLEYLRNMLLKFIFPINETISNCIYPETKSSHMKIDDWKTAFLLGLPILRGYLEVQDT